jgi:hypothetical protein
MSECLKSFILAKDKNWNFFLSDRIGKLIAAIMFYCYSCNFGFGSHFWMRHYHLQLASISNIWRLKREIFDMSKLRRYGRYRPWCSPLSLKLQGWQILWWHYAQESVLSDIRKKLKKTSWRYFGQRL